MSDRDPFPFGKYKGTALINVPAHYLLFIYKEYTISRELRAYIEENLEVLKTEQEREQKQRKPQHH